MDLFNDNRVNQQSYYEEHLRQEELMAGQYSPEHRDEQFFNTPNEGALLHPGRMQAPPMGQSPGIGFMQNFSVDLFKKILHESRMLKQDGESTYSTGNTGNNSVMMERSNEDRDSFNKPFARKQINQLADKEAYLPLSERLGGKSYGSSAERNIPPENSIDYKFQSNLSDDPERNVCVTFLYDEPFSSLDRQELLDVFADFGPVSELKISEDSKLARICFEHVVAAADAISVMNDTSLNTGGPILKVEQFSISRAMHAANKSLSLGNAYSRGLSPVSSHSRVRSNRSPAVTESRGHSPPFADTRHHSPKFDGLQVAMHSRSPSPIGDEIREINDGATILVSSMNVNDTHLLPNSADIKKYFKFYGRITKMVMGEYPLHAYITYNSKSAAEKAISSRNGHHRMQGGRIMKAVRAGTRSDHLNIENDVSKRDMREERRSPVREERLGSFPRMSKERERVPSSKEVRMRLGGGKASRCVRRMRTKAAAAKRDRTPEIRHEAEKARRLTILSRISLKDDDRHRYERKDDLKRPSLKESGRLNVNNRVESRRSTDTKKHVAIELDMDDNDKSKEKCRNGEDKIEPVKASNSIAKLEKVLEIRADIASAKTIASLCPINLQKPPAFDSDERFGLEHVEEITTFYCKPCDYKVSSGRIDLHCKLRSHYDSTFFMLKERSEGRGSKRENRTSFLTNQVQMPQSRRQRKKKELVVYKVQMRQMRRQQKRDMLNNTEKINEWKPYQNERAGSDRINISEEENDFPLEVLSDAGSYQEECRDDVNLDESRDDLNLEIMNNLESGFDD